MTSQLATNAVKVTNSTRQRYLQADKNGFPLERQIPRTYQVYTGVGGAGVTIDYDGSDELVIFGENLTGPLIVRFGPTRQKIRNWIGRELKVQINGQAFQTITLDSSPAFLKLNGTAITLLSHIIPGDGTSKTITVSFSTDTLWNLDYGAAVASLIPVAPIPLQANPQIYNPKYLALVTVNIPDLVLYGQPPYEAIPPPMTTGPIDRRLGSINTDNGSGTIIVYHPQGQDSQIFTVPVQVRDNSGAIVTSAFTIIPDTLSFISGTTYPDNTFCTYVATVAGTQGIYTKPNTTSPLLVMNAPAVSVTNIAGNQKDSLIFYQTSASPTSILYYDPLSGAIPPTGTVPISGVFLSTVGITTVRCLSYNHDTDELYVFGNTVTSAVYIMKFDRYQRSDINPPTLTPQGITVLTNALDPTTQPVLAPIYATTSYVTGCEFVDGLNVVVLAIWDPVANRGKLVSLNSQMFKNRGTSVGVAPVTYHDQYVIGAYDNAVFNAARLSLGSMKVEDKYAMSYITSTAYGFIKDYSFFNNVLTTLPGFASSGISGLPTEIRGTRTLINY